ncbi:MAG: DUF3172 domain-containing protein [Elainellaceae cyanobacterium]
MKRRPKPPSRPPARYGDRYTDRDDRTDRLPEAPPKQPSIGAMINSTTLAILGAVLVLGIGLGAFFGYSANFSTENVASRVVIEESVANPEVCAQYGAGAITVDLRAFVTLNPFKVFISQPLMQPGCVLRSNNWAVLEKRDLVSQEDVRQCKQRMNTFGFTGDIAKADSQPKVDCVYENDSARNLFLRTGIGGTRPESDRF